MVSPNPVDEQKEEAPTVEAEKTVKRKKKTYRGETVADRLIAQAARMQELRIAEEARLQAAIEQVKNEKLAADETKKNAKGMTIKQEEKEEAKKPRKLTKQEKLNIATHEIDDLSDLEWETGSEKSV